MTSNHDPELYDPYDYECGYYDDDDQEYGHYPIIPDPEQDTNEPDWEWGRR